MAVQFGQDGAGLEQEHAAVPGEAAAGQKALSCGPVGLLNEAGDRHRCTRQRLGRLDVAVTGLRGGRHDAEGHELIGLGGGHAGVHGGAEPGGIGDHVVGGQHQQQRVLAMGRGLQGRDRHGRRGVAAHRFQQDPGRLHTDLAHLLGHDEAVLLVADQQRCPQAVQALQPLLGLLQQGLVAIAGQGPVLLGVGGAGQGPQPGARAAAQDHRDQGTGAHRVAAVRLFKATLTARAGPAGG